MKTIHFVGVKGVGMAPLAVIAKEAGFHVTGCDVADEFMTDIALQKAGINVFTGFSPDHVDSCDLVITTGAHNGMQNPEVTYAVKKSIPVLLQGQAVGTFMTGELFGKKFIGVSIAGCHGKTTTTAMTATIFTSLGFDPSFMIGTGEVPSLGASGHFGKGKYFIAEADEYATAPYTVNETAKKDGELGMTPKFLWQHPDILVITNIEYDHPDVYKNIEQVRAAYSKFVKNININGVLIGNGDDTDTKKILKQYSGKVVTFGYNSNNNYVLNNKGITNGGSFFTITESATQKIESVHLNVVGGHNILNAAAAILTAREASIPWQEIKKSILQFTGTKRRFEYKGTLKTGAKLYDDYAHHPSEIKATLQAFSELFPQKKLIAIFQPHTYSRTKQFLAEFSASFTAAHAVVITSIFGSAREAFDPEVTGEQLSDMIAGHGKSVLFLPTLADVVEYIRKNKFNNEYCLITLGAGDIYNIEKLLIREKLLESV